uniref:Uncharacterized protein n=1 Tax=Opuntia streptacantha TaxID=393608 RepID=A0A7C9DVI3_OPUST
MLYCFCFPPPITFQLLKRLYCLASAFSLLQSHLFLSLTPNAQLSPTDHSLSTSTRPPPGYHHCCYYEARQPRIAICFSSLTIKARDALLFGIQFLARCPGKSLCDPLQSVSDT